MKQKSRPFTNIVIPALDRSMLKRQLNLSPGLAKIAPYLPCHRDSLSAKVPRSIAGWLRQVTLTAHTRWPLGGNVGNKTSLKVVIFQGYQNDNKELSAAAIFK